MDGKLIDVIGELDSRDEHYKNVQFPKDLREDRISDHLMKGMSDKQRTLYKLIHPNGKGLTPQEAASKLNVTERSVYKMLKGMKEKYQNAFIFEDIDKRLRKGAKDITHIFDGYKRIAKTKELDFTLSVEDLEEIVQLPCYECEAEPKKTAVNLKTGNKFKYHHLGRFDTKVGYIYINCKSVCKSCIEKGGYLLRSEVL